MYKASIEIFRVTKSCVVTFNLILRDSTTMQSQYQKPLLNKFSYLGNDYLKITPHPFLTVNIKSSMDKKEEWSTNMSFNMNKRELYVFIQRLNRIYKRFTEDKELFFYNGETLIVNKEKSYSYREVIVCNNKTILIQACVIDNNEDKKQYEGVFLSINTMDYFSYLTYTELGYFIYELVHVDMNSLTLQLINTALLTNELEKKEIKNEPQIINETKEKEIIDTKKTIGITDESVIPDI